MNGPQAVLSTLPRIESQRVYDVDSLQRWLEALDRRHLLARAHILVCIGPLRSVKVARYTQTHIPDVFVPPRIIERMERSSDARETRICEPLYTAKTVVRGGRGKEQATVRTG